MLVSLLPRLSPLPDREVRPHSPVRKMALVALPDLSWRDLAGLKESQGAWKSFYTLISLVSQTERGPTGSDLLDGVGGRVSKRLPAP